MNLLRCSNVNVSTPARSRWATLLSLLLALLIQSTAFAQSDRSPEARPPVRLLLPSVNGSQDDWLVCLGLHLREQLSDCTTIDAVDTGRAHRWSGWLRGAAFSSSTAEYWQQMQRAMAIDAEVQFRFDEEAATLELTVLSAASPTHAVLDLKKVTMPEAARQIGQAIAQSLQLGPDDAQVLTQPIFDDPDTFRMYYRSQLVWARYPANPYEGILSKIASAQGKPRWAMDAARLRVSIGYLSSTTRYADKTSTRTAEGLIPRSLAAVLGTPGENTAFQLEKLREIKPELLTQVEAILQEMVKPLTYGAAVAGAKGAQPARIRELEELDDFDALDSDMPSAVEAPNLLSSTTDQAGTSVAQQLGAVRALGMMPSPKTLELLKELHYRADPAVRAAVVSALQHMPDETGLSMLKQLAADPDLNVQLHAHLALWHRRQPLPDVQQQAQRMLASAERSLRVGGATILCQASNPDPQLLQQLATEADPQIRRLALPALAARTNASADQVLALLNHADAAVVQSALQQTANHDDPRIRQRLFELCNDVDTDLAWAARDTLLPTRPTDPRDAARFDLLTLHHHLRHRRLDEVAASSEPWASQVLVEACSNPEPYTRIKAMQLLLARDAAAACPKLLEATSDAHRIVQLNACAMLAQAAQREHAAALEKALASVQDEVSLMYLRDALARATGSAPLPPRPAARSVADKPNLTWLCGGGTPDSPYQAYYQLHLNPDDHWRNAYAAGKIFFARIDPVSFPGVVIGDRLAQDNVCLAVDALLPASSLEVLDGVVYGEESMTMSTATLWRDAWRVFCFEAGIDHKQIEGKIERLSASQRNAWNDWSLHRAVEGFNFLYDYTKLRAGKLRPGLQVCTFLPTEMMHGVGVTSADFDWKFDLGGIYHYIDDSRKTAFSLVRRYKTIWPDRPVLWLSHGIGCYERTPVQYHTRVPTSVMLNRNVRAYTDTVTAFLAGAQTGWFSIWPFQKHDWVNQGMGSLRGPSVRAEDLYPGSQTLLKAIDYSFAGVDERYRNAAGAKEVAQQEIGLNQFSTADDLLLEEPGEDPILARIKGEKQRMYEGFLFYRKYLFDAAHLMASLPRPTITTDQLVVEEGISLWEGSTGSPGADLLAYYDFLPSVNMVDRVDLSKYRLIAIRNPALLRDATIAALTRWLKQTPGLLYISGNLPADNAAEFSTVDDLDGNLQMNWPWEADVAAQSPAPPAKPSEVTLVGTQQLTLAKATVAQTYAVNGSSARTIYRVGDQPVLVLWQHAQYQGAVIFDGVGGGGAEYRSTLAEQFNALAAQGVGKAVDGDMRIEQARNDHWGIASTSGSPATTTLEGADLLTGAINPTLAGKSAAVVGHDFVGLYAAAHAGVAVLSDQPLQQVEKTAEGLTFQTSGALQVVTQFPDQLRIATGDGSNLPTIADDEFKTWLLMSDAPGMFTLDLQLKDDARHVITYVRSTKPLHVGLTGPR